MRGEMLRAGGRLQMFGIMALHTMHKRRAEQACQIGTFAVGLLSTAPTWIAEDVDVW